MAKKSINREVIHLACPQCKDRTYTSSKNKKNDPGRLELNKYCPRCKAHVLYKEIR